MTFLFPVLKSKAYFINKSEEGVSRDSCSCQREGTTGCKFLSVLMMIEFPTRAAQRNSPRIEKSVGRQTVGCDAGCTLRRSKRLADLWSLSGKRVVPRLKV